MKIAVSGKGGVGKTTLSAGLIECFVQNGREVYAIDADPDTSLGITLGLDEEKLDNLVPLIDMREVIENKNAGGGVMVDLNPDVADVLEDYCLKENKIKFFKMGGIKQGGTACYCKENSFLYSILNSLLLDKEEPVVIDMSAGIEHLTRGTARGVDVILVVTEPTLTSVKTAGVVKQLANDLGIGRVFFVGNKVRNEQDREFLSRSFSSDELAGIVPFDEGLLSTSQNAFQGESKFQIEEIKNIWKNLVGGEQKA